MNTMLIILICSLALNAFLFRWAIIERALTKLYKNDRTWWVNQSHEEAKQHKEWFDKWLDASRQSRKSPN